jgi:ferritin-like protein
MTTAPIGNRSLTLTQLVSWLTTHLNATVAVEFFTIPVYLTAIYSFSNRALEFIDPDAGPNDPQRPLFDMQQRLLSVAVQEMYHMQLAANLCNALGETTQVPQLTLAPNQPISVPHLNNVTIPRMGNVPTMLQAMIDIETPSPEHEYPQPNEDATYDSIADLYHATAELLGIVAKAAADNPQANDIPPFTGGKQVSYGTFTYTYKWNEIPQNPLDPIPSAVQAINAITDQGEGKNVIGSPRIQALLGRMLKMSAGDDDVNPSYQPAEGTRFYAYGALTHYKRFEDVQTTIASARFKAWDYAIRSLYKHDGYDLGVFYQGDGKAIDVDPPAGWKPAVDYVFASIHALWSTLTDMLQSGFGAGTLSPDNFPPNAQFGFNDVMLAFKYALPLIWREGYAPSFHYKQAGTYDLQNAFDVVDPFCVVHWDTITSKLRADESFVQNVCQGLNTCKGRGWGGTGVKDGGGDCACCTADLHTCDGGNSCTARGACGYLSTDASKNFLAPESQWIPSLNQGKGSGGCQTPISTSQVFSSAQKETIAKQSGPGWTQEWKDKLTALAGKNVWEHARTLHNWSTTPPPKPPQPPESKVDYDGLQRRQAVQASVVE